MRHLILCTLIACGSSTKGDTVDSAGGSGIPSEGSWPYCEETLTPLGWDEAAPDGTVPAEALAAIEGETAATLTWDGGGSTPLTLTVTADGEPAWVEQEAIYPATGTAPAIGVVCWDQLRIPVSVTLTTEDGQLDETWSQDHSPTPEPYTATGEPGLALWATLDPDALTGSYTLTGIDPADYDFLQLSITGSLLEGVSHGGATIEGQQTSGEAVSFGHVANVASW
jgi:hypothetical protein